jgi:hypothetical protein
VRFFSLDPGEMNTQMHADAMPDADVNELQSPDAVAATIVQMIRHSHSIASGSRLSAAYWQGGAS